jgi:hypothetical protein
LHGLLNRVDIELVNQNAIQDSLTNLIVVLGLEFDIWRVKAKRFAAIALGSVLAVANLSPEFLLKC